MEYLDTLKSKPDGKLILVTAITQTPAGEGKTTTSVGLNDGLNKIGKKYKWDNDFLFLLLLTSYKKYTNYLSSSKDRMREQLKNKDN